MQIATHQILRFTAGQVSFQRFTAMMVLLVTRDTCGLVGVVHELIIDLEGFKDSIRFGGLNDP